MKQLDIVDYSFLRLETETTPMHVGSFQIFEFPEGAGDEFLDELVDFYSGLFEQTEPFNQKLSKSSSFLGIGMPDWVNASYDPRDHLKIIEVESPGTQQQLDALVSKLNRPLLPRDRPLWHIHLIKGLPDNRFAVFFKVHHACIDGMGGMRLMQSVLKKKSKLKDGKPKDDAKPQLKVLHRRPRPKGASMGGKLSTVERLYDGLKNEWNSWGEVFSSYQNTMSSTSDEKENLLPQPFSAPHSSLNGKLTPERSFAFRSISLHEMKRLRKQLGVTANDLVMAVCAGALRNYLLAHGGLPSEPLISMIPVSVRSKSSGVSGNELSFMLVNLATHLKDPLERLKLIQASANKGKELLSQMSRTAIKRHASLFSSFSILTNAMNLDKIAPPPFNVVISNVPSSRDFMYMHGAKLLHLHPVSFLYETQALNITIVSYEYTLDFGFIACDSLVPNVGKLADAHVEAFAELQQVAASTVT